MQPDKTTQLWMLETMLVSRAYEDAIKAAYMEGKTPRFNMADGPIPGEMHLSSGQEPCAVGVCAHLSPADAVTATHRPHHIAIAKGVDLNAMTAEIFGKVSGLAGGRGGHMHLFDPTVNFCCSGIIAEGMGPALGAALGRQLRKEDGIAVAFIGEGAANQGAFHETLNLAAVWNVGVVFVIEDNAWGISVAKSASTAVPNNAERAAAYGIPGYHVAENDPDAIYATAREAIERARSGDGPSLIEIQTLRLEGHFLGDAEAYRPEAERESKDERDPIPRYITQLRGAGHLSDAEEAALRNSAAARVDAALAFARSAPLPLADDALTAVFA
ncbi:MAG: thiamine pyrophosphate-dependent dehydrogenase E1 component subunit alpha [Pseudomonadota bacterium]